jgi:hypothetical protein
MRTWLCKWWLLEIYLHLIKQKYNIMDTKLMVNLGAALVPLVVGSIWYSPFVFGKILMRANGKTPKAKMTPAQVAIAFGLTYIGSYFIAARVLGSIVIHQHGLYGMLANQPDVHTQGTELYDIVQGLMNKYGTNFRTFKHGALHGSFTGLFLVFPVLGFIGLYEPKPLAWVAIHSLYWIVCLAVMGGIICAYMP